VAVTLAMVLALAYVLGSIPTSYIVVHAFTGRDVRTIGNGNPGMMNVWDNVGLKPALLVALGDIGKGAAAVLFAYQVGLGDVGAVLAALMAVAGHDFSIFLRFHGGNGTAAAVGGLFALVPQASLPAALLAVGLFGLTRSKRFAGVVALLLVPVLAYYVEYPTVRVIGVLLLLSVVALKIVRFEGFTPVRSRPPRQP
jgi:glycerol-3-phosphate acyltransferase PlsY